MLRSILAAVGRAFAWAANGCVALMLTPVHAILGVLFPAAYEPLFSDHNIGDARSDELFPNDPSFDPFADAEQLRQSREVEISRILTWAAESSCADARIKLPDVRPELLPWLASLYGDHLDALVRAGRGAAYGHLYWSIPIPGVPSILGSDDGPKMGGPDQTFNSAESGPAPAF